MPQSLVHEFLHLRRNGASLGTSLKRATFQAKSSIGELQSLGLEKKRWNVQLWKVQMRGVDDGDPV
jgi:hypothetical protein